jgi:hypothetical protein
MKGLEVAKVEDRGASCHLCGAALTPEEKEDPKFWEGFAVCDNCYEESE